MRVTIVVVLALTLFVPAATAQIVSGTIFLDSNFNGINDAEAGQGGVSVTVFDDIGAVGFATTLFDGTYAAVLSVGAGANVVLEFNLGVLITGPFGPDSGTTVIFAQSGDTGLDLGVLSSGAGGAIELGSRLWKDEDGGGVQDPSEPGLPSVVVELYESGTLRGTATTNANGQYLFNDSNTTFPGATIPPNTLLEIRVDGADGALLGCTATTVDNGNNDLRDSDGIAVGANVSASFTTGTAGVSNHTVDFGFQGNCPMTCLGSLIGGWLIDQSPCRLATLSVLDLTATVNGTCSCD